MITLIRPGQGETVSLQTAEQRAFLADEAGRAAMDGALSFCWYDLQRQGTDGSQPQPVEFVWEQTDAGQEEAAWYLLLISESPQLTAPQVYMTAEPRLTVFNLKVDTVYYWCVQRNGRRSETASFRTAWELPRCIRLDGVSNVRDVGGYAVNGGRIRQGLLYRGGELDLHMHLTPEGALAMHRLGIRTELDMRGEARGQVDFTTGEAVGLRRLYIPCEPYGRVFEQEPIGLHDFFEALTHRENYPLYFHCWGGADRVGTFAFLLGALLGMEPARLIDEYEFTTLCIWGVRTRNYSEFRQFLEQFQALPGGSWQEKAAAFLKARGGLSHRQLEEIYDILVERRP